MLVIYRTQKERLAKGSRQLQGGKGLCRDREKACFHLLFSWGLTSG